MRACIALHSRNVLCVLLPPLLRSFVPTMDYEIGDGIWPVNRNRTIFVTSAIPIEGEVDTFRVWYGAADANVASAIVKVRVCACACRRVLAPARETQPHWEVHVGRIMEAPITVILLVPPFQVSYT